MASNLPSPSAVKKVAILIGHFGRGGCERQAFLLSRELVRRHGLRAEVWGLGGYDHDAQYAMEFEAAGVRTKVLDFHRPPESPLRPDWGPRWATMLRRIGHSLRGDGIDVLLPFTTWPNIVAGLTYRFAGIPLCIWGERHAGGERVPLLERIAARQYRRFVANSTAGVNFLAGEMRVPRERVSFVPNGVEEPKVIPKNNWRDRLRLTPGEALVVKIANVTGFKDHVTLLRAWKIVQDHWSGAERPLLALAGACYFDDLYNNCLRLVRESGMETTVRFLESIPDVPSLIQAADIAVFSSRNEGMPNGVLECMAAGKAVVATDLPGIRDALGQNASEALVPPGNADGFARLLLDFLRNDERRRACGAANLARIRSEFSIERMAERHLSVIGESMLVTKAVKLWASAIGAR